MAVSLDITPFGDCHRFPLFNTCVNLVLVVADSVVEVLIIDCPTAAGHCCQTDCENYHCWNNFHVKLLTSVVEKYKNDSA